MSSGTETNTRLEKTDQCLQDLTAADVIETFHSQPEVGEVTDPFLSGHQADRRRFIVELPIGY
jgi:hypothetical protein